MERTEVIFLASEGTHITFSHLKKNMCVYQQCLPEGGLKGGVKRKASNLFSIRQQLLSDDRIENSASMDGPLHHALSREEYRATEHGRLTHIQSMRLPHVFHGASQLVSAKLIIVPRDLLYMTLTSLGTNLFFFEDEYAVCCY